MCTKTLLESKQMLKEAVKGQQIESKYNHKHCTNQTSTIYHKNLAGFRANVKGSHEGPTDRKQNTTTNTALIKHLLFVHRNLAGVRANVKEAMKGHR